MLLFKSLRREKAAIQSALELITDGLTEYIRQAAQRGVKIISFADPTALIEIMGTRNYMEFSGKYCVKLLKVLQSTADHLVVHVCGRNSAALESCGLTIHRTRFCEAENYWNALLRISEGDGVTVTGKRCMMNSGNYNNKVWELILKESAEKTDGKTI